MSDRLFWLLTYLTLASGAVSAPRTRGADTAPLAREEAVQALAARIDKHLAAGWSAAGMEPAPLAVDAEFLRRVYLDVAGRIPSVAETRAFLKDSSPEKRLRLVEHLLASPRYVTHGVNVWRALLLPETSVSIQV